MRRRASIIVAVALVLAQLLAAPGVVGAVGPTWSTVRLSDNRADRRPCVTTDAVGVSYVAFGRTGHQPGVWLSTNRSGTWRTRRLTTGPDDACGGISVDPLRHVHLLVARGDRLLYLTNRSGGWRTRPVASAAGHSSLVSDRNGRVAISYEDPGGISIASNRSGRWHTSRAVRGPVASMSRLTVDGARHLWLSYATSTGVYVATNRTGSWRSRLISPVGLATVDLGLDATGHAYVALQQWSGGVFILSNRSGAWRRLFALTTSAQLQSLSVTRAGRLHLLLETGTGTVLDRTNRTGTWRTRTIAGGADAGSSLSVDRFGHVTTAWTLSSSVMLTTDRSGSLRMRRLTSTSRDRVVSTTTDTAGHRYVLLARSGVGAGIRLATDRSGSWTIGRVTTGTASSGTVAVDASGHVHIAHTGANGARYAVERGGSWLVTALPPVDRILLVAAGKPSGVIVAGTRGSDVVLLRPDPSGWLVDVAPRVGACVDAAIDAGGALHLVCAAEAGIVHVTNASGSWTSNLVATLGDPLAELAPEAIAVAATGTVSIAFAEFADDAGLDLGAQEIASNAGGSWTTVSPGNVSFVGSAFVDLATDASGRRHLLTSGSGLVETTEASGSWLGSRLPLGTGPTIGRLAIDASGAETVGAEIGAAALAGSVDHPVDDAGVVVLTR